jgi:hypothetical protein
VKKLSISPEAERKLLRIATEDSIWAQREVARIYVCLTDLESRMAHSAEFWNIRDSASGNLTSCATLKDGTPVWRLCTTHVHCIALVAMQDDDLFVLELCSRAEIDSVERTLINR